MAILGFSTETTIGKTLKVLVWTVISGAVIGGINAAANYLEVNKGMFDPIVIAILFPVVNSALVAIKNFFDPQVKNF